MFGLGIPEVMIVLVIALLFFGPSKLPSLGKSIGEAIRGFKKGIADGPAEQLEDAKKIK
jgi:sec-independent protein translocase protein TatA